MRNLKRVLSLTLASVMLLGMMVVGSSAAGFPDVSEEDNVEAIEVIQAVEVMVGDENGNFRPDSTVSRAEMAVIIAKLLDLDYDYYASTCPFADVDENGYYSWARGPIGVCYANKYLSGRSETIFDPGATVTAVEASSMLMRVLGYFQYSNDVADGFELSTVRQGTAIGIYDGVGSSASEPMTRNQVAKMVLNALKSGTVTPDGNTTTFLNPDGTVLATTGKVNYVYTTSYATYATAISSLGATSVGSTNTGYIVELGEQLYNGDLELRDKTLDAFGRPARTWFYKGSEIGTYVKKELLVMSTADELKGREVYEKLTASTIQTSDLAVYLDGHDNSSRVNASHLVRSNDSKLNDTGRGVITEIYLDIDWNDGQFNGVGTKGKLITIVSVNTFLAKANGDYSQSSENATLTVYTANGGYLTGGPVSKIVDIDDTADIANVKKDDWMLVQWADEDSTANSKTVVNILPTEILENQKVTSFKRSVAETSNPGTQGAKGKVTEIVSGETYKNNAQSNYKTDVLNDFDSGALVNKTYTLYLDQFGNFIGVELYSGKDQYVFITGYDRPTSAMGVSTAQAAGIFVDGTMDTIKVNVPDTNKNIGVPGSEKPGYSRWTADTAREEMWYKYSENNGVYTLTPVENWVRTINPSESSEKTITCSNVRLVPDTRTSSQDAIWITEGTDKWIGYKQNGANTSFGSDNSVYITVEYDTVDGGWQKYVTAADRTSDLKDITTTNGAYITSGITGITGTYSGVQNINLICQPNTWVNAVCDSNNFIVAAVVVGEAEGVVDNYAYICDGVVRETITETDSRDNSVVHYWDFDVIMNGEKTTKTIKSKFTSTVDELVPGTVQELVLDADGYVTKIRNLDNSLNRSGVEVPDADVTVLKSNSDNVFSNYDYLNNDTIGGKEKPNSTDLANYSVLYLDIAGQGNGKDLYGANAIGNNVVSWGNKTLRYSDIALNDNGNSMRFGANDTGFEGLVFMPNAKAIVKHQVNNSTPYLDPTTVDAAFASLYDADYNTATNSDDGVVKQFCGRVVAVLNSSGRAEWVFFEDLTPQPTGKEDSTIKPDAKADSRDTVEYVNGLLRQNNGGVVVIDGDWTPLGVNPGHDNTDNHLEIPRNTTLWIKGSVTFDGALTGGIIANAGSKLIVDGNMTNGSDSDTINYDLEVKGTLNAYQGTEISSNVKAKDVVVADANGNVLEIKKGATLTAENITRADTDNAPEIHVYGTLDVEEDTNLAGTTVGEVKVFSVNSLKVGGTLTAKLTVGDGTNNPGKAIVGTLNGDLDVKSNSGNIVEISGGINKSAASALAITIADGDVTIEGGIAAAAGQNKTITISGGAVDIEADASFGSGDTLTVSGATTGTISGVTATAANTVTISSTGTAGVKLEDLNAGTTAGSVVISAGTVQLTGTLTSGDAAIHGTTNATVTIPAATTVSGTIADVTVTDDNDNETDLGVANRDVTLTFANTSAAAPTGGAVVGDVTEDVANEEITGTLTVADGEVTVASIASGAEVEVKDGATLTVTGDIEEGARVKVSIRGKLVIEGDCNEAIVLIKEETDEAIAIKNIPNVITNGVVRSEAVSNAGYENYWNSAWGMVVFPCSGTVGEGNKLVLTVYKDGTPIYQEWSSGGLMGIPTTPIGGWTDTSSAPAKWGEGYTHETNLGAGYYTVTLSVAKEGDCKTGTAYTDFLSVEGVLLSGGFTMPSGS